MKIQSFIRDHIGLRVVEVEVSLTAGLPKIQFLGLPDAGIKESILRIQSALRYSQYSLPKSKQVLVNLKPNYLKKSSRGIDLAIAAAIIWETKQEVRPDVEKVALYGELSLKGGVHLPDDFEDLLELPKVDQLFTGPLQSPSPFNVHELKCLRDLKNPRFVKKSDLKEIIKHPKLSKMKITKIQKELIEIIATGEHPTLMGGPPGTGKTTLGVLASQLLKDPKPLELKTYQRISRHFGLPTEWRPIVTPHHSSTALAMIGGGNPPRPGEITRAHGGVLIMDEFLEFHSLVQEALREPMESGKITISRTGGVSIFPARFLLLATTNLCPCGHLIPIKNFECQGRVRYCHSSLQKLSGPMMDRFSILSMSHEWGSKGQDTLDAAHERVRRAQEFAIKDRGQERVNHYLDTSEIEPMIDSFDKEFLMPSLGTSHRRYQALLKVARTIADLDLSSKIKMDHINKAKSLTLDSFKNLKDFSYKY